MAKNGNTEIKNTIFTTDKEAQYDKNAKQILVQKQILAHILVYTVEEFKGILKEEYKISMEEGFGKDVEAMCNLGQGIKEAGIREGIEIGRREERKYTEREKKRADELERKNAWLTELLTAHGIQV